MKLTTKVRFSETYNYIYFLSQNQMEVKNIGRILRQPPQKRSLKHIPRPVTKTISKEHLRNFIRYKRRQTSKVEATKIKFKNCLNQRYLSQLIDQSKCECPICIDLAIFPVILDCGHVYCLQCFQETSVYDLRCALCRVSQSSVEPQSCPIVQTLINQFILPKNKGAINYWCRQADFKAWEKKRKIDFSQLRMGDCVDIRDDDHIWRKGVLKNYSVNSQDENCINVRIKCQGVQSQIELLQSSRRLAKYGFFTKTMYLKERTVDHTLNFVQNIQIPELEWGIELFFNQQSLRHHRFDEQIQFLRTEELPQLALQLFNYEIQSQIAFQ